MDNQVVNWGPEDGVVIKMCLSVESHDEVQNGLVIESDVEFLEEVLEIGAVEVALLGGVNGEVDSLELSSIVSD